MNKRAIDIVNVQLKAIRKYHDARICVPGSSSSTRLQGHPFVSLSVELNSDIG